MCSQVAWAQLGNTKFSVPKLRGRNLGTRLFFSSTGACAEFGGNLPDVWRKSARVAPSGGARVARAAHSGADRLDRAGHSGAARVAPAAHS